MKEFVSGLFILCGLAWSTHALAGNPALILIDGFTDYIGGYAREYCAERKIEIVDAISPYLAATLQQQGRNVPDHLKAPTPGDEVAWIEERDLNDVNKDELFCISESDSGVSTAERLQVTLGIKGNGLSPHIRNKFQMNQVASEQGIDVVRQKLASSWEDVEEFIRTIGLEDGNEKCIVIKPCRGVASDGVYLCRSKTEAETAFKNLLGKPRYEGGRNEEVVVQEFVDGPEYAVDTVSKDGDIKVVALWKYRKFPANGAPFVYQCTELVAADTEETVAVCDHCLRVLKALRVKWGPTHTEIKQSRQGPRLIEVNARWHSQNFVQIARRCLGYDAVTTTMETFYEPDKFDSLPKLPTSVSGAGRIVHLVSFQEGTIRAVRHQETIKALESVQYLHLPFTEGDTLVKTVDIRTDCGYVVQVHPDPEVVARDYETILQLQETLFDVESSSHESETSLVRDGTDSADDHPFVLDEATPPVTPAVASSLVDAEHQEFLAPVPSSPSSPAIIAPADNLSPKRRAWFRIIPFVGKKVLLPVGVLYLVSLLLANIVPLFRHWIL